MPNKENILSLVSRFGRLIKIATVCLGILYWAVITMAIWIVLFILDNLLVLPAGLRLPMAIIAALAVGIVFLRKILFPVTRHRKIENIAVSLERKFKIPDNLLINACQFQQSSLGTDEQIFAEKTIAMSESMIIQKKPYDRRDLKKFAKWGSGILALFVLWAVYVTVFPGFAGNAWARYLSPMKDIPPASNLKLVVEPKSNITIMKDENLSIRCITKFQQQEMKLTSDPILVWRNGVKYLEPAKIAGENTKMKSIPDQKNNFIHQFRNIKRSFSFRVFAENTYSKSVTVTVLPPPKIKKSFFVVTPPDYTGTEPETSPGPSSSLSCLEGSGLRVEIKLDSRINSLTWKGPEQELQFTGKGMEWVSLNFVATAGTYSISAIEEKSRKAISIAAGEIRLTQDKVPEIEFLTDNRNRYVNPGTTVELDIKASDDFGVNNITIMAETSERNKNLKIIRTWSFLGPPGKTGEINEKINFILDPQIFIPGKTYLIKAECNDFCSKTPPGTSRPIILRIRDLDEISVDSDNPLASGIELLKKTIAEQTKANGLAENIKINLDDIFHKKSGKAQQQALKKQQGKAVNFGKKTLAKFKQIPEGKAYISTLEPIVTGEMNWVMDDINKLDFKDQAKTPGIIASIEERQQYILNQLISLLGTIAERNKQNSKKEAKETVAVESDNDEDAEELLEELQDDLKQFVKDQKKMVDLSKTLMDNSPEDLTDDEEKILGKLAREQAEWAKMFEEKLTDLSKLPLQDFGDSAIAEEFNEVFQEIKLAEKSLYEKKIELAVPHEQSGIEKAEELIHNLERWLPDTPDHEKWLMEEPMEQTDIPLAELPLELEDIVGELLDSEEEMTDEVEDVSSSWMDSLDKGAGWDAMDGPISNMSARGVTGNRLPNKQEIGGRSGEGRTGRSHGQIVEASAEGKGGRQTPTRLTPSPFEQGSVDDSSKAATGGSTGGGKLSGFTGEGLRGPAPPKMLQKMARLAGQQAQIRQKAEALALRLRAYNLPTGDIESSINQMKQFENAVKTGKGPTIRKAYSRVLDHLSQSKRTIKSSSAVYREKIRLPEKMRSQIMSGLKDRPPKGYEAMIGEYFRVLAEEQNAE